MTETPQWEHDLEAKEREIEGSRYLRRRDFVGPRVRRKLASPDVPVAEKRRILQASIGSLGTYCAVLFGVLLVVGIAMSLVQWDLESLWGAWRVIALGVGLYVFFNVLGWVIARIAIRDREDAS